MANIQEIAKLAGVSKATMLRILNQDTSFSVSEATEKRVWKIVNKLQYKLSSLSVRDNSEKLPTGPPFIIRIRAKNYNPSFDNSYLI
ncbi:LacI family DNA-binding transcriptional regulator [Weissella paramesenteroides]|uniref:LacI family DNA-binding transcriptional regulator n=1 Tax=Weissella paramesenteroides TaxID=1249 RepID=UPI003F25DD70